jgi:hypothetical protein
MCKHDPPGRSSPYIWPLAMLHPLLVYMMHENVACFFVSATFSLHTVSVPSHQLCLEMRLRPLTDWSSSSTSCHAASSGVQQAA